jgi:hypothetical protein
VAETSSWRRQWIIFRPIGTNLFNGSVSGVQLLDTVPAGWTHVRTLAYVKINFLWGVPSGSKVNYSGWWQDAHIHLGLYIPGILDHASITPNPRLNNVDDDWIFNEALQLKTQFVSQDFLSESLSWGFATNRIDVQSQQGPTPTGGANLDIAWDWNDGSSNTFNNSSGTGTSWAGMQLWTQTLWKHA